MFKTVFNKIYTSRDVIIFLLLSACCFYFLNVAWNSPLGSELQKQLTPFSSAKGQWIEWHSFLRYYVVLGAGLLWMSIRNPTRAGMYSVPLKVMVGMIVVCFFLSIFFIEQYTTRPIDFLDKFSLILNNPDFIHFYWTIINTFIITALQFILSINSTIIFLILLSDSLECALTYIRNRKNRNGKQNAK